METEKKCIVCSKEVNSHTPHAIIRERDGVYICADCIDKLADGLEKMRNPKKEVKLELKTPKQIYQEICKKVIGQEHAKKVLSVAVYNHYKRIMNHDLNIEKNNILLAGPSGCGKTYFAKTLAEILNVPFTICDATKFTEAGYVGDDVESCITTLYQNAGESVMRAEAGIVYIDEIDKISKKDKNPSVTRDVTGEGVQNALLKMIEGTVVEVPVTSGKRLRGTQTVSIDTSNILFICGGAFSGIEDKPEDKQIGFVLQEEPDKKKNTQGKSLVEKYIDYGMTREFMGRLPIIAELDQLTKDDLVAILTNQDNSLLKHYQSLFALDNIELVFDQDAVESIAELALERNLGARGLKSIMEEIMLDLMFEVPSDEDLILCKITKEFVTQKSTPILIREAEKEA